MRLRHCMAALIALPALAQPAGEFGSNAPLTLSGSDPLQRVVLPFEAYRDARADLGDIRVLNRAGEAVPMAFAGEGEPVRTEPQPIGLPLFPVAARESQTGGGGRIVIRATDGTLVQIFGKARPEPTGPGIAAWFVDASRVKEPVRGLDFHWTAGPGTQVLHATVEASDDLRTWSGVASGPLVRIEHEGRVLAQPRLEFAPRKAKYYRITSPAQRAELRRIDAVPESRLQPPARKVHAVAGARGPKAGEYVFDAGARLPVEALRIVPAEANSVVSVEVLARNDERSPWRSVHTAAFYRLVRDGADIQSPPMEVPRRDARHWLVRVAPGSGAVTSPPTLELHWRPAQLVFVARGEPPFTLAFGNAETKPAVLAVASLLPGYEPGAELKLPQAEAGQVKTVLREPPFWKRFGIDAEPRKIALWAILVAGVLLLAVMAWRLQRQMKHGTGR